ncbi:MAG: hypothetical protein H6506_00050 [Calditrichaeota bacterium]|nr:hypothetical protein [Calditrichota bacterium]MCB9391030.1 hypothetical protein [Calditrichota bacterium]
MGRRLQIYLERLSLDELLFLEHELDRRKLKFKKEYSVLAVQPEQKLLTALQRTTLVPLSRELRRHYNECAAAGGGILLAYSPEVSLLLMRDVKGAETAAVKLFTGLAEVNGRLSGDTPRVSLKLGLATGEDVLAAGSVRSIRQSELVRRASQCAWKSPAGAMLIDERSARKWEPKSAPVRLPIEIEGNQVFRVTPSEPSQTAAVPDNDKLEEFVNQAVEKGVTTLKYSLLREEANEVSNGAWSKPVARAVITVEGYDSEAGRNMVYTLRCAFAEYSEKVDYVRRVISDRGLGLVKHEVATQITA